MAGTRVAQHYVEVLADADASVHVAHYLVEVLADAPAPAFATPTGAGVAQYFVEVLQDADGSALVAQYFVEVLQDTGGNGYVTQYFLEVLADTPTVAFATPTGAGVSQYLLEVLQDTEALHYPTEGSFVVAALVNRPISGSFPVAATIRGQRSGSFPVDAWIRAHMAGSFTLAATVLCTKSGSFTLAATVLRTASGSFPLDAEKGTPTISGSFPLDGWLGGWGSFPLAATALVTQGPRTWMHLDAVVVERPTGSFPIQYRTYDPAHPEAYTSRRVATRILVAGVDITSHVNWATARFTAKVNGAVGDCLFEVRDDTHSLEFTFGQEIQLLIDGVVRWGGWISRPSRTFALPVMPEPVTSPRKWQIEGVDFNAIFDKRVIHDLANPERAWNYAPGSYDDTIIRDVWRYFDMEGFTLSVKRVGVAILDIEGVTAKGKKGGLLASGGFTLRDVLTAITRNTAAIFYCSPTKVVTYLDSDSVSNPYVLTDQPYGPGGVLLPHAAGYREAKFRDDITEMCNDALVVGAGYGGEEIVASRHQDATSKADYGRWQKGNFASGIYKQATADAVALSYVEGSPSAHRGQKNPKRSVELVTDSSVFSAGDVVRIVNNQFGVDDVLPIRQAQITFPTPYLPRFQFQMSWEIDADWSMSDPWIPSNDGPGGGGKPWDPPPPPKPDPPAERLAWFVKTMQEAETESNYADWFEVDQLDFVFWVPNEEGTEHDFDLFDRVVAADGWGTSTDGHAWTAYMAGNTETLGVDNGSVSVNGALGIHRIEPTMEQAYKELLTITEPGGVWSDEANWFLRERWIPIWNVNEDGYTRWYHLWIGIVDVLDNGLVWYVHKWWNQYGEGYVEVCQEGQSCSEPVPIKVENNTINETEVKRTCDETGTCTTEVCHYNGTDPKECITVGCGCGGAGTGGSGCGVTDSFTRTVADGWGTSDAGYAWYTPSYPWGASSVSGGLGYLLAGAGGPGVNSYAEAMLEGFPFDGSFSMLMKFRFKIPDGADPNYVTPRVTMTWGGTGSFYDIYLYPVSSSFPELGLYLEAYGSADARATSPLPYGDSGWLWLRWEAVLKSYQRVKFWADGDLEPGAWTLTESTTGMASFAPTGDDRFQIYIQNQTWAQYEAVPLEFWIDSFDIAGINSCGSAGSGCFTDTFTRTVASGLGTSDAGIAWDAYGATSVDGGHAVLVSDGTAVSGMLSIPASTDATLTGHVSSGMLIFNLAGGSRLIEVDFTDTGFLALYGEHFNMSTGYRYAETTLGFNATAETSIRIVISSGGAECYVWPASEAMPGTSTLSIAAGGSWGGAFTELWMAGWGTAGAVTTIDSINIAGVSNCAGFGYDNFNRTTFAELGTSSSGYPWTEYFVGDGNDFGVNGSALYTHSVIGFDNANIAPITTATEFVQTMRIMCTGVPTSSSGPTSWNVGFRYLGDNMDAWYTSWVEVVLHSDDFGSANADHRNWQIRITGGNGSTDYLSFAQAGLTQGFELNTWYTVEWDTAARAVRMWADGTAKPAGYALVNADWPGYDYGWLHLSMQSPVGYAYLDTLDFDYAGRPSPGGGGGTSTPGCDQDLCVEGTPSPAPGQRVTDTLIPLDALGMASGFAVYASGSEWGTRTASYVRGSCVLYIDGRSVTTFEETDPRGGVITINATLGRNQSVRLSYMTNGALPMLAGDNL